MSHPSGYTEESNRHTFLFSSGYGGFFFCFVLFSCVLLHPYIAFLATVSIYEWYFIVDDVFSFLFCTKHWAWKVVIALLSFTVSFTRAGQVSSLTGLSLGRDEQQPQRTLLGCIEVSWNTHVFLIVTGGLSLSLFCWLGLAEIMRSITSLAWKSCSCQSSSFEKSRSLFFPLRDTASNCLQQKDCQNIFF